VRLFLASLLATASLVSATTAFATVACHRNCRCDHWGSPGPTVYPYDGSIDVPTNARIFVGRRPETVSVSVHVFNDPREGVAFDVVYAAGGQAFWIVPREVLRASTTYEISVVWVSWGGRLDSRFSTGEGADIEPPVPAEVGFMTPENWLSCDPLAGVLLHSVGTSTVGRPGPLLEVLVQRSGQPDVTLHWLPFDAATTLLLAGSTIEGGICEAENAGLGLEETLPNAEPGQVVSIMVTAIDEAGNESLSLAASDVPLAAVEPSTDTEPSGACCGCRAVGSDRSSATPLVAPLVMLFFAMRRIGRQARR
jgi:hypothetical protein